MNLSRKLNAVLLANIGTRIYLEDEEAEILFNQYRLSRPTKKCCDNILVWGFFEWNERPMRLAEDNEKGFFVQCF